MRDDHTVPRRSFLSRLSIGLTAFGAAAVGTVGLPTIADAAAVDDEMDRWFGGMKGTYKAIYDCAAPNSPADGVMFARNLIKFSADKLGTKVADNAVVVCFRHFATPFGYGDAAWAKYPQIAEMLKVMDPKTNKPATRNWLLHELVENEPGVNIPGITASGVHFAICGAATSYFATVLAGKTGNAKAIEAELVASLIPNAKMAPAGVVAVQRAQKAGFAYTFAG